MSARLYEYRSDRRRSSVELQVALSNAWFFDRLVAALCAGQIGAALCLDAAARSQRPSDWRGLLGIVRIR